MASFVAGAAVVAVAEKKRIAKTIAKTQAKVVELSAEIDEIETNNKDLADRLHAYSTCDRCHNYFTPEQKSAHLPFQLSCTHSICAKCIHFQQGKGNVQIVGAVVVSVCPICRIQCTGLVAPNLCLPQHAMRAVMGKRDERGGDEAYHPYTKDETGVASVLVRWGNTLAEATEELRSGSEQQASSSSSVLSAVPASASAFGRRKARKSVRRRVGK